MLAYTSQSAINIYENCNIGLFLSCIGESKKFCSDEHSLTGVTQGFHHVKLMIILILSVP